MQVAAAPHYPAEPRALVGGEVLEILEASDRSGRAGEIVRQFFADADAGAFARTPPESADVLGMKPEFETVLHKLEERL